MSSFFQSSPWIVGNYAAMDATPADEQSTRPAPGSSTGMQALDPWALGFGVRCNGAVDGNNPCGFPGYGGLYVGSYFTYDWMLEHPVIQHARSMVFDPIIAAPWGYEQHDGAPAGAMDFIKGMLNPLRMDILADSLRSLDYGKAPFEKVWRVRKGKYELECLKPLSVYTTGILVDTTGQFAGLRPQTSTASSSDTADLDVHKSHLFSYDVLPDLDRRDGQMVGQRQDRAAGRQARYRRASDAPGGADAHQRNAELRTAPVAHQGIGGAVGSDRLRHERTRHWLPAGADAGG
jgi:hypothetical protein